MCTQNRTLLVSVLSGCILTAVLINTYMSKTGKIVALFVVLVVIIIVLVTSNKPTDTSPIKIGFVGPLTGDVATLGTASKAAVGLAVKELNDAGGIDGRQVEVIYEDGKCAAASAANAGQKLIEVDKVSAIIGGLCSGETASFVGKAMENKIPTISYCSSAPSLTGSGPYFFRDYPSDAYAGVYIAEYLYNTGARKVAILYPISDYGTGLKDSFQKKFEALGGTVTIVEGAQQTVRDYKTQLAKIKATNSDYIFAPLYTEGGIPAVKQAKDLGVTAKWITADTASDPKFLKEIPQDVEVQYVVSKNPDLTAFKNKFTAFYGGTDLPTCTVQAYDAAKILFAAIDKAGLDPDKLKAELHTTNYSGVSGVTKFDANGDLTGATYQVFKAKAGKAEEVK